MRHIHIFDIDNTLIDTKAKVIIRDVDGNIVDKLNSQAYNNMSRENINGIIDFSEFRDLDQLMSEPKLPAFGILTKIQKTEDYYIITARDNPNMIYQWLTYCGLYCDESNMYSIDFEQHKTLAKGKVACLEDIIQSDKDVCIHIWEDDVRVIKAIREYCNINNIKLYCNEY